MLKKNYLPLLLVFSIFIGCAQRNTEESAKHLKLGIENQNKGKLDEAMNEYNKAIRNG